MKLIIFASFEEAKETIALLNGKETDDPSCFSFDKGKIVISGWGSYHAMMAVSKYGNETDEVINLGIAASLKKHRLGEIVNVKTVSKYSLEPFHKSIPCLSVTDGEHLITTDFPIHSKKIKEGLHSYDILDMEGYGVVFASHYLKKKVRLIKVVSDFAIEGGSALIKEHMATFSKILAKQALSVVSDGDNSRRL